MQMSQDDRYQQKEVSAPKLTLFNSRKVAKQLLEERKVFVSLLEDYGMMNTMQLQDKNKKLQIAISQMLEYHRHLKTRVTEYEDDLTLLEQGYYEFEHPAKDSVALQEELKALRTQIKSYLTNKTAATATSGFKFNNSEKEGKKFVEDMKKLLLRAYNAEAENAIKSVKSNRSTAAINRVQKSKETAEKLGSMIGMKINEKFHKARIREIELAFAHFDAVELEKEAKREAAIELREQKQAEMENQKQKERLQKEAEQKRQAIAQMLSSNFKRSNPFKDEEQLVPDSKLIELQKELSELEESINDAEKRAANMKAGYVYVISNIGSLGENTVKIGMTRRVDPMDRIKELGSASVAFPFDVHMIHYSDNAVGIENALHKTFANRRVNLVNGRKEHFYATPAEVKAEVMKLDGTITTFNDTADAHDWHESEKIRNAH